MFFLLFSNRICTLFQFDLMKIYSRLFAYCFKKKNNNVFTEGDNISAEYVILQAKLTIFMYYFIIIIESS
jgi:hypothetical protein